MKTLQLIFVFGTRPEAIKMAPLVLEARKQSPQVVSEVIVTAQHRQMLDDVLDAFSIEPDVDLDLMAQGQSLPQLTARICQELEPLFRNRQPDYVVVQGDTTTAFAAALCAFYAGIKVAHVEAGLRTGKKWAPFPEEMNRRMTSCLTDIHFAPTESAKQNLLREGYPEHTIHVTGNPVIDALQWMGSRLEGTPYPFQENEIPLDRFRRFVLITGHRRESFGEPFRRICAALRTLAENNPDVLFVYPVHLNPNVQEPVYQALSDSSNILLLEPLNYPQFVWLMQRSYLIITDSGGIQEEAPALGKPVVVTRNVTERPEAVEAGVVKLVGDDTSAIIATVQGLLSDPNVYRAMARGVSPYGDGKAASRIVETLKTRAEASAEE